MNPLEIVQKTPKTNCRSCGYPTCLAYAAAVSRGGENPAICPYIEPQDLEGIKDSVTGSGQSATDQDFMLIAQLKEKVSVLDFQAIAPALGAEWREEKPDTLLFVYLNQQVTLDKSGILLDGEEPEDPRDQILLYNYVHAAGGDPPERLWVGLESLPNSISKVKTLEKYGERPVADLFSGKDKSVIESLCKKAGGEMTVHESAVAFIFQVLPMIPQYLLFWDEEPEDGFDAYVKILFDMNVLDFLDIESLVFSSERLAERLVWLAQRSEVTESLHS